MPTRSTLARLQQFLTALLVAVALGWLGWHWTDSPLRAVTGVMLIFAGHAFVLAAEFIALHLIGATDPADATPRPTVSELVKAWAGETLMAPRVFCWRQPFRWRAIPDHLEEPQLKGRRGVVFVHGFVCNRGFWMPWLREMKACGHAFAAVNLEPVFGSIDAYVPLIDDAVMRVTAATGLPPVLVCHSMGGLAARAWLQAHDAGHRVAHVVTLGTPHRGTWLARFSHVTNGRQMRIRSPFLLQLERARQGAPAVPFTCWYSNCDNIVFPVTTATLPDADNRLVRGVAHVDLAFEPQVMQATFALLRS